MTKFGRLIQSDKNAWEGCRLCVTNIGPIIGLSEKLSVLQVKFTQLPDALTRISHSVSEPNRAHSTSSFHTRFKNNTNIIIMKILQNFFLNHILEVESIEKCYKIYVLFI